MGTVSLATLEQRVWDTLDNNTGEFVEANVRAVLNQGLFRLNLLVGFYQTTVAVPGFSVKNQHYYATPTGILVPLSCDFEGQRLDPYSRKRLAREYQNFSTDAGVPQRWVRMGLGQFFIHPADSVGGGYLEITGVGNLTQLVNPGDTCQLSDWHVDIVVNWARATLLLNEGGKAFADASIVNQRMQQQARSLSLWRNMAFPKYWILKTQNDAKGTTAGIPAPQGAQ